MIGALDLTSRIRCLLVSPLPPGDTESGDCQYTRDLLADPPDGVEYVHYSEALETGELRAGASWALGERTPHSVEDVRTAAIRLKLHALRRLGALLPEPVRCWHVSGSFDVIHVHYMPTRFTGVVPPVVATDSAGGFWYWTHARGMPAERVWSMLRRERKLAQRHSYVHPTARPDGVAACLFFVESGIRLAAELGATGPRLRTCSPGVPSARTETQRQAVPTLAFVARNFEIKGGPDALEIHRRVREVYPNARLLIAGPVDRRDAGDGVEWLGPLSRQDVYDRVYSQADVFVYPSRFDAAPFAVFEALAHGMPVVAPRMFALPDMVRDQKTGFLFEAGDVEAATSATLRLLADTELWTSMSAAARADFEARFSVPARARTLSATYREAVQARRR